MNESAIIRRVDEIARSSALKREPTDRRRQEELYMVLKIALLDLADAMLDDQQKYVRGLAQEHMEAASHA